MRFRAVLLFAAATAFAADYAAEGKLWWTHVERLAGDDLQGRNTGSPGFLDAVRYVEGQFEKLGLKPAGTNGYLQPVPFETRQIADSSVELLRDGKAEPVTRQEASLGSRGDVAPSVEAPLVFVGYGMSIPEAKYDDLAGLDLKGKIAVYFNAPAPVQASGNVRSHFGSSSERWAALRRAGAVGVATLPNPRPTAPNSESQQQPFGGGAGRGGRGPAPPSFALADRDLQETAGQQVSLTITRAGAARFFAGSGHTFEELETLVKAGQSLPRFPLSGILRATASVTRGKVEAPNVVGLFP